MDLLQMKQMVAGGIRLSEMPLRVAYYARVSTEKDEQLNSLTNQREFYRDFITKNAHWTFAGEYVDEGISGASVKKRDSFLRMIDHARQGLFDLIVTKEISRFSRNTLDSIAYTRELLRCGVGVFFHNDNINTLDPDAELRLTIMAAIAQEEVNKLSQRTRFGFAKAQENGVLLGQDNIFGYKKENKTLTIIPEEAEIVRKIYQKYCQGELGLRALARELEKEGVRTRAGNPFTPATLRRMIDNPKYKGFYAGNKYTSVDYREHKKLRVDPTEWIVFRDETIPAIVDEETWNHANAILAQRGKTAKEHGLACQNRYPYSGKLICAEHGVTFHRHVYHSKSRGDQECWNCKLYRLKGKKNGCDSPTIYSKELDQILNSLYEDLFLDKDRLFREYMLDLQTAMQQTAVKDEKLEIEKNKRNILQKKEKLLELVLDGALSNDEFKMRNRILCEQLELTESRLLEIEARKKSFTDQKRYLQELKNYLESCWQEQKQFLPVINRSLLDHINVVKGDSAQQILLEIYLNPGLQYQVNLNRTSKEKNFFSLSPMGISQAQVSRLEKGALQHLKKYV